MSKTDVELALWRSRLLRADVRNGALQDACAIDRWNRDDGCGPSRIDPGFDPALKAAFEAVGLGDMLH